MDDGKTQGCSRRQFLAAVPAGIGAAALGALLPACGGGPAIQGTVMVTNGVATLTFIEFPALMQAGGGVLVDAGGSPIAVARTTATAAIALDAVCTHAGCTLQWANGVSELDCACHGSGFSPTGSVLRSPARRALATYAATITASGIAVTVG